MSKRTYSSMVRKFEVNEKGKLVKRQKEITAPGHRTMFVDFRGVSLKINVGPEQFINLKKEYKRQVKAGLINDTLELL